jgi:hypothetical protein
MPSENEAIQALIEKLDCVSESPNYEVRYCMRDPKEGVGNGRRGVPDLRLVVCYIDNLERLHATLSGPLFGWSPPQDKVRVYLLDLDDVPQHSPFAHINEEGKPYIVLPCRSLEPSYQMAYQRAAVEAIHEATHTFSYTARNPVPASDPEYWVSKQWYWFNEATSVYMEGLLMPTNPESIRFARNWSDSPHVSLDQFGAEAEYASGLFARYLARRFGPSIIARIWNESTPLENPFQVVNRLIPAPFRSRDPKESCRIFRQYCIDSYFVWDHESVGFAADVWARFGNRAITESHRPLAGKSILTPRYELDHLACHYHRVWIPDNVKSVHVELKVESREVSADVAVITRDMRHSEPQVAAPSTVITGVDSSQADHVVVVVSNTGIGATYDGRGYQLTIAVE